MDIPLGSEHVNIAHSWRKESVPANPPLASPKNVFETQDVMDCLFAVNVIKT